MQDIRRMQRPLMLLKRASWCSYACWTLQTSLCHVNNTGMSLNCFSKSWWDARTSRTSLQHASTPNTTHTKHERPDNSRVPNPSRDELNFTPSLSEFIRYSKLLSLSSSPSLPRSSSICPSQKAQRRWSGSLPFQVLLGEVHHCTEHVCVFVWVCVGQGGQWGTFI